MNAHLPLEVPAYIVRNAIAIEAEDVDICHHACRSMLTASAMARAVPIDGLVESKQCGSILGKVRPYPGLRWPTKHFPEIAAIARVPIPLAVTSPPRVVEKLPTTVAPARAILVWMTGDPT